MLGEPKKGVVAPLEHFSDPVISIALDTFKKERQLITFVNTKRGAESQAEKIAAKLETTEEYSLLADKALKALSSPTKQCKRLALCLKKGVAFHHAGLHSKQRELIEEGFREKKIKSICATPTLAFGLDLPAFRVIVRDLKRYGGPWGMTSIPVLEYEQMCGRCGRPGKDPWGEAICIAKNDREAKQITEFYLKGEPEEIYSKLAVEPVLRTYILSLVASEFVIDKQSLFDFFGKTFYAAQYGDTDKLRRILESMIIKLQEWEFLKPTHNKDDFTSAADMDHDEALEATPIGKRVSELYLDPYTAHHLLKGLHRSTAKAKSVFALTHLCSSCLELRPYVKVRQAEFEKIEEKMALEEPRLLHVAPTHYSDEFDTYLDTVKTAMLFEAWMEEADEETLLEGFNVRPGELHAKLERMDWLVYAASELAKLTSFHEQRKSLLQLKVRLKHGAKKELLPLLKLRAVGRVRARKLYRNNIKDVAGIQRADITLLAQLLGKAIAFKLKEQVGQRLSPEQVQVKPGKRKGQKSVVDWEEQDI
ncbi:hypothetical protein GF367_04540 [Candidatus Woesearchaeota archaeon]|nr:hypothetical protein [Candidatus Woesearchaeota archaeon]